MTTPSFIGKTGLILHPPGPVVERLRRQLAVLGLAVRSAWVAVDATEDLPDLVLVDADAGWSGLFPWDAGCNPMPLVALLGSEAPGRVAWALEQGCDALIAKPVTASAVYPALVMASHNFAARRVQSTSIGELEEKLRLRPLVVRAVDHIMRERRCSEAEAMRLLRRDAMRNRLTLEAMAASRLAGRTRRTEAG
jgi:AmiR/NasT family two-component response regulator